MKKGGEGKMERGNGKLKMDEGGGKREERAH